jgi:hypothetical protein
MGLPLAQIASAMQGFAKQAEQASFAPSASSSSNAGNAIGLATALSVPMMAAAMQPNSK